MAATPEINKLQRRIHREYVTSIGLKDAAYYGGARLRPVIPLDTAINSFMIIGAYPSARFEAIGGERDVPVGDNLGPFEPERYFDGERVRTQASADELAEFYLKPLGIDRSQCWVTDLVKVFLFKEGHRAKYERLGKKTPAGYERERFEELAERSLPWIEEEIAVARPRLVITLGAEVAGIVRGVRSSAARVALLGPEVHDVLVGARKLPVRMVHLAHPGIVMRKGGDGSKNKWPNLHSNVHVPALKERLARGVERVESGT